ncbi:Hypothetical protein A7982_10680 [Minicystis rosea]|nr:Hypothetical protein A7982_10680 [Minicystis rosea]
MRHSTARGFHAADPPLSAPGPRFHAITERRDGNAMFGVANGYAARRFDVGR